MNTFELHILAAERSFYEGPCESLVLPTTEGMYGIQANHLNMVAGVVPGEITFRVPGGTDEHGRQLFLFRVCLQDDRRGQCL